MGPRTSSPQRQSAWPPHVESRAEPKPAPKAPANSKALGVWENGVFRFNSPEAKETWDRQSYDQGVNTDTWAFGKEIDAQSAGLTEAGLAGAAMPGLYRGPDGKYRLMNSKTIESEAARDHRNRHLKGMTLAQLETATTMPGADEWVARWKATQAPANDDESGNSNSQAIGASTQYQSEVTGERVSRLRPYEGRSGFREPTQGERDAARGLVDAVMGDSVEEIRAGLSAAGAWLDGGKFTETYDAQHKKEEAESQFAEERLGLVSPLIKFGVGLIPVVGDVSGAFADFIRMLELISELSSDTALYIPLVHQTYSELSLEDEKEDDYMFRSLASARKNADDLELNVTLLHHSICVFGHNLSSVFDPNEVLRQHFDIFKNEVGDKVYHPMKTYDSLGLYSLPVINILKKWQRDNRLMAKLVSQAKYDPSYMKMKASDIHEAVNRMLQETIDVFSRLDSAFEDIDRANAKYTQAVQKKVNFLSASDKTIKGKLDTIILQIAKGLESAPTNSDAAIDTLDIVEKASDTISVYHQGFVNPDCLTMPFKRNGKEEMEPLPLEDQYEGDDDLLNAFLENEVNMFSAEAVENFMLQSFGDKKTIETKDFNLPDMDHLVLLILGTVRAEFGDMFYTIEKIGQQTTNGSFALPNYRFTRKGKR